MYLHWDPQNLLGVAFLSCFNDYFFVLSHSYLCLLSHFFYTLLFIGLCTLIFLHFQSLPQPPPSSPPTSNLTSTVPPWRPLVQWGGALHCISCILSTDYKAHQIKMSASMKYISWECLVLLVLGLFSKTDGEKWWTVTARHMLWCSWQKSRMVAGRAREERKKSLVEWSFL